MCESVCYYSVQYSTTKWPSDKYEGYLFADLTNIKTDGNGQLLNEGSNRTEAQELLYETLKSGKENTLANILQVSFTFEELNKQTYEEEKVHEQANIIATVGGNLGLCVGISFMTVGEILEYTKWIF